MRGVKANVFVHKFILMYSCTARKLTLHTSLCIAGLMQVGFVRLCLSYEDVFEIDRKCHKARLLTTA